MTWKSKKEGRRLGLYSIWAGRCVKVDRCVGSCTMMLRNCVSRDER